MSRVARYAPGGVIYHVLNRANGRLRMFKEEGDYLAFEQVLLEASQRFPMRILDWCCMPTHWHFVLWPEKDGQLSTFMRWLTLTHAQRWKHAHNWVGLGHLYQDRFKSFPLQDDHHLLVMLRYVERNPVRAGLVERAQDWRWGSCFVRHSRTSELRPLLNPWPIEAGSNWLARVNSPQTPAEEAAIQEHIRRGRPYGSEEWITKMARSLNLEQTIRPRGRPLGWRRNRKKSQQ